MAIRITDHPRIGAWIAARANDTYIAAYQRAEDALTLERHKVRNLQHDRAAALRANEGLRNGRQSDAEALASLNTQLTIETALVDQLSILAHETRESVNRLRSAITESHNAHPSHAEGEQ